MRIRVKVCGITRARDAAAAVAAGADALGFIFVDESPRCIPSGTAREIIDNLPPFVDTVGVFVDRRRSEVEEIVSFCRLSHAQLHGGESVKFCERLARHASPCRVIKAFRVRPGLEAGDLAPYHDHVCAFLLDTFRQGQAGGTGECFDWSRVEALSPSRPLVLAGGLHPGNVAEAIRRVRPFAVDVSSGVEERPGIKDHQALEAFVRAVRQVEEELEP